MWKNILIKALYAALAAFALKLGQELAGASSSVSLGEIGAFAVGTGLIAQLKRGLFALVRRSRG